MPRAAKDRVTLTEGELGLKESRGRLFRKLLTEATGAFLDGAASPAILLSGGVDSTTALFAALDVGARPAVFTFTTDSKKSSSSDARKAEKLAALHGLPFTLVELPRDPDEVARRLERIVRTYREGWNLVIPDLDQAFGPVAGLNTRPDYEVGFVLEVMFEAIAAAGHDVAISGIGDGSVHLLSRELETFGRTGPGRPDVTHVVDGFEVRDSVGGIPLVEADTRRIEQLGTNQVAPYTDLARRLGVRLALPIRAVAALLPYARVPWHVMNLPRNKAITIEAFAAEEQASGFRIRPTALQCGDTGTREYLDGAIGSSAFAREVAGREVNTAAKFFNSVVRNLDAADSDDGQPASRRRRKIATRDVFLRNTTGRPLPDGVTPVWPLTEDGLTLDPYSDEAIEYHLDRNDLLAAARRRRSGREIPSAAPESFFDDVDLGSTDPEYIARRAELDRTVRWRDAQGRPDRRVDCSGTPFYFGPGQANTDCARAIAGLCGVYRPEAEAPGYDPFACETFVAEYEPNRFGFELLANLLDGTSTGKVYLAYADRIALRLEELLGTFDGLTSEHLDRIAAHVELHADDPDLVVIGVPDSSEGATSAL